MTVNQDGTYSANDEWYSRFNAGVKIDFFMATSDCVERARANLLLPPGGYPDRTNGDLDPHVRSRSEELWTEIRVAYVGKCRE